MESIISQNCPLCNASASFQGVDYGRRKNYECPNCTNFQITNSAERRLSKSPQNWKDNCSEKAKITPEGQLLAIRLPAMTPDTNNNSVALEADYHPKSELP